MHAHVMLLFDAPRPPQMPHAAMQALFQCCWCRCRAAAGMGGGFVMVSGECPLLQHALTTPTTSASATELILLVLPRWNVSGSWSNPGLDFVRRSHPGCAAFAAVMLI